ncbi:zinc finger family protein [Musa troglodytarum]|uniref:Zinc finger family protein n=1 Tax=Musa troglodytarum TaxID=320322 RepID=A0A9E7FIQ3_9LILI|nr:zinc finger family protein [Musa troglodytarum]
MGTGGWRRAFCTSVGGDPETTVATRREAGERQQLSPGTRSCAKLIFFSGGGRGGSNPSTPRLDGGLRCRTRAMSPYRPKLQCETPVGVTPTSSIGTPNPRSRSPALFRRKALSAPSSPRSPSRFGLFKHLSSGRCRLCWQSLKRSQETPVFTADCSHAFHFPCIAAHVRNHSSLACPVCSATWRQPQLLSALHSLEEDAVLERGPAGESENPNPNGISFGGSDKNTSKSRERQLGQHRLAAAATAVKVYDDDEPLVAAFKTNQGGGVRFNPIPEAANEDEDEYGDNEGNNLEQEDEFNELLATPLSHSPSTDDQGVPHRLTPKLKTVALQVSVIPQATLLSEGRKHRNYVVAVKVKAPSIASARLLDTASGRAPIDLVTVLDVGQGMMAEKLLMLKRSMRLVVSSLGPVDRLSVVAFSAAAGAKRLIPLRRMSRQGQRAARRIVDRLAVVGREAPAKGANVGDALRKAAKVLEDRRERNPVATIMLLSESGQQQLLLNDHGKKDDNHHHKPLCAPRDSGCDTNPHPLSMVTSDAAACFAHLEIPLVASGCGDESAGEPSLQKRRQVANEDAFIKCVGGLPSVVMRDVRLQLIFPTGDISAVYPCSGRSCGEVAVRGGSSVLRLGDLYAEEEREFLVELRVLASSSAAAGPQKGHHQLVVKCNYRDPATQELTLDAEQILLLPPELSRAASSSACSATPLRLRNLYGLTRAGAESRRLADLSDYATAHNLFSSARSLLLQSASDAQDHHVIQNLDEELADLQRRRLSRAHHQRHHPHGRHQQQQEECLSPSGRRRRRQREVAAGAEVRGESDTPTSAWRAAEQLAKVAIIRKSLNRVSDLHGFEHARF